MRVFCVFCGSILSILFSWAEWAVRRSRRQFRAAFCDYHVPKIKAKDKIFCPVFLTIQQLFSSKICPNNPFPFKSPLFQSDFFRCYLWTAPTWECNGYNYLDIQVKSDEYLFCYVEVDKYMNCKVRGNKYLYY